MSNPRLEESLRRLRLATEAKGRPVLGRADEVAWLLENTYDSAERIAARITQADGEPLTYEGLLRWLENNGHPHLSRALRRRSSEARLGERDWDLADASHKAGGRRSKPRWAS